MSSTLTTKQLVEKGYFPQEVAPSFTTTSLAATLPVLRHLLSTTLPQRHSKCEHFTIPKIHNLRRVVSIPNPLHQIVLSRTIAKDWNTIKANTDASTLSESPLELSHPVKGMRCFAKSDFRDEEKRLRLATTSRYLLQFDISRFYSSIYTHSIPWALHTKSFAKAHTSGRGLLGNALDIDVRNTQESQTNGIPIGPDTSRVLSEIIATAIDSSLLNAIPTIKGTRNVDDFSLYFSTLSQLEEATSIIHSCLSEYHLESNAAKFKISELPQPFVQQWPANLGKFKFSNTPKTQIKDLFQYFSLSYEYAQQFPGDYVLPYAVSRLQKIIVSRSAWPVLEDLLLHTLFIESKTIRYVFNIIFNYAKAGYPISKSKLDDFLNEFILVHKNRGQPFEIAWACWLAKQLEIKLNRTTSKILSSQNNSLVALSALDLQRSKLLDTRLDTSNWRALCTVGNLYSEHWLLIYEAVKQGWLRQNSTFFDSDPFFKILKDNNVKFYDASRRAIGRVMTVSSPPASSGYPF